MCWRVGGGLIQGGPQGHPSANSLLTSALCVCVCVCVAVCPVAAVCVRQRVPRLIYTSTVNVAFGGKPIEQGDEDSVPYFPLEKVPGFLERWAGRTWDPQFKG